MSRDINNEQSDEKQGENRFIGEKIDVITSAEEPTPVRFNWHGKQYVIKKIIRQWQDHGYSQAAPVRNWRTRRHRNNYVVEVDTGDCFEIYLDRGSGRRVWYVYRIITNAP